MRGQAGQGKRITAVQGVRIAVRNGKELSTSTSARKEVLGIRREVLGQARVAKACAYHLNRSTRVSKTRKSKITTNSSNSTTPLHVPIFSPSPEYYNIPQTSSAA